MDMKFIGNPMDMKLRLWKYPEWANPQTKSRVECGRNWGRRGRGPATRYGFLGGGLISLSVNWIILA